MALLCRGPVIDLNLMYLALQRAAKHLSDLKLLTKDKILDLTKFKAYVDDNLNVGKVAKFISMIGLKTLREKVKMLAASIFFFSHNVFKRCLSWGESLKLEIVNLLSANAYSLVKSKILLFCEEL